jgi:hypothetical protein
VRELVASLLKQFVQDHPVISEWVMDLYRKHYPGATSPSLNELMETLRKEVGRYSKVFIIIDALDELVEHNRGHLINYVQSLSNTVNLMVTSRPLSSNGPIFRGAKSIDIRANEQDVREYIKHRILDSSRLSDLVEAKDTLRECILDKVSTNAGGMYVRPSFL